MTRRQTASIVFVVLCVVLVAAAVTLNIGWILVNVYPSKFPGGDPSELNPILLRYTTVNLYAAVQVGDWIWYQVGDDQLIVVAVTDPPGVGKP